MPQRPVAQDTPGRVTQFRKGTIRARIDELGNYIVDLEMRGTEMAFSSSTTLAVGTAVQCRWRAESNIWAIF